MDRAAIKSAARQAIKETTPSPYLVVLAYLAIIAVLNMLQRKLTGVTIDYDTYYHHILPAVQQGDFQYVVDMYQYYAPSFPAQCIGTLISVMALMLGAGYTINTLRVWRRQENSVGNLFDGFGIFFKILWLEILAWLFTFLWSLLLVIPGIIASYRYRQALFILIDDPSKRAIDCIRESKEMMRGHKAELFVMDLSFLGWFILCAFVIPAIYVLPYTAVSYAGYFDELRASAVSGGGDGGGEYAPPEYTTDPKKDDGLPPWEYK